MRFPQDSLYCSMVLLNWHFIQSLRIRSQNFSAFSSSLTNLSGFQVPRSSGPVPSVLTYLAHLLLRPFGCICAQGCQSLDSSILSVIQNNSITGYIILHNSTSECTTDIAAHNPA